MSKKYLTVIPMLILCLLVSCLAQPGGVITDSCTVSAIPGVDESTPESSDSTSAESSKPLESSVPADSSRSISSASSESTSSSGALEWWQRELSKSALLEDEDGSIPYLLNCAAYRNSDMMSVYITKTVDASLLGKSSDFPLVFETAKKMDDLGEKLTDVSFMEFLMSDDTKYTMTFYEKGIALTKALPGENTGEPVLIAIDDKDYQTILTAARESLETGCLYPTWLSIIRETRCDSFTFSSPDGNTSSFYTKEDGIYFDKAFGTVKNFEIEPGTSQYVEKSTILPNAYKIEMQFSTGVTYQMQCNDTTILIASSDIDKAIQYSLTRSDTAYLEHLAARDFIPTTENTVIPETAKPVIYLYPENETDVSVKVRYKGEFTCTYPAYNDGWEVTAYPDGRLINHADDTEYYYLFWEGNYRKEWSFDEGFVIKGEETEAFLQKALCALGLTPREYNDFIVYWLPEMQHNPYNLITFATDEYEDIAPLEISPKPDSVLRVHMVYKALLEPVEIRPQVLTPFTRKGFTVVEWGGTRAK